MENLKAEGKRRDEIPALTEWFIDNPRAIGGGDVLRPGSTEAAQAAVRYVSGMTDRFANAAATDRLGWDQRALPRSA